MKLIPKANIVFLQMEKVMECNDWQLRCHINFALTQYAVTGILKIHLYGRARWHFSHDYHSVSFYPSEQIKLSIGYH